MIVKARKDTNLIVFELEGQLDFESTVQFRDTCLSMMSENPGKRVVFNLMKLKFVGSSGINQFIKVLKDFNTLPEKPRYCHLSSEFEMIFRAYQTSRRPFEIFEAEIHAVASFDAEPAAPKKAPKASKKTIEQ